MNIEERIQEWVQAQNSDDLDTLISIYAENGRRVAAGSVVEGRAALRAQYSHVWGLLPNRTMTLNHLTIAGNVAVMEYTERATHSGAFTTAYGEIRPSGKDFEIHGCGVMQFEGEHLAELRVYSDALFHMYALANPIQVP